MSKLPLAIVVLAILLFGFVLMRSASSTIRFFTKILTWVVILAFVIGTSWIYSERSNEPTQDESSKPEYLKSENQSQTWH